MKPANVFDIAAERRKRRMYCGSAQLELCGSVIPWHEYGAGQRIVAEQRLAARRRQEERHDRRRRRAEIAWSVVILVAAAAILFAMARGVGPFARMPL